jgi:hypothetical protein
MKADLRGYIIEIHLRSNLYAYLQYLYHYKRAGTFVRVLRGRYENPIDDEKLSQLCEQQEQFVSRCLWDMIRGYTHTTDRGFYPVPVWIIDPPITRVDVADSYEGDFYRVFGREKSLRGWELRAEMPEIDLKRLPRDTIPSPTRLYNLIDEEWEPGKNYFRIDKLKIEDST